MAFGTPRRDAASDLGGRDRVRWYRWRGQARRSGGARRRPWCVARFAEVIGEAAWQRCRVRRLGAGRRARRFRAGDRRRLRRRLHAVRAMAGCNGGFLVAGVLTLFCMSRFVERALIARGRLPGAEFIRGCRCRRRRNPGCDEQRQRCQQCSDDRQTGPRRCWCVPVGILADDASARRRVPSDLR